LRLNGIFQKIRNKQDKGVCDDVRGICSDLCSHRDRFGGLRGDVLSIGEHDEKTPFSHTSDTANGRGSRHPPIANIRHPDGEYPPRLMEGDQLMEIKSLAELEKRAMAEISIGIYGEELSRIMLPELKEYLNDTIEKDEVA
jgi:hypothetical protein